MANDKTYGEIAWMDLTVPAAGMIRDFYQQVVGWKANEVDMGGYVDYEMLPAGKDQGIAGICYQRSANSQLPPYWLIYILVENLEESIARCKLLGGRVIDGPRENGICVIQDPAGAFVALYQAQQTA